MLKKLMTLVAMMGLFATTGCMAPVDAEEIEGEADEAEQVGEAEEAFTLNLGCTIVYSAPPSFDTYARILNSTLVSVPSGATINYTIVHAGGLPNHSGSTSGPLNVGSSKNVLLTHTNAPDAVSCTATATW